MLSFIYWQFPPPGDPSVDLTVDSVSLRLGHGAALTCPRHVIHSRAAASLPSRGAKAESLPRSAAPLRGSPQCAHWGKGSPELSLEQRGKERADLNNHCHSEERSDVGIRSP